MLIDLLSQIARETAKMSWPGRMHSILQASTKGAVVDYFAKNFLPRLSAIWTNPTQMSKMGYAVWHHQCVSDLGTFLQQGDHIKIVNKEQISTNYKPEAVACKLHNTFMYQLMKYQACRYLWNDIHLILDNVAFRRLHGLSGHYSSLKPIASLLQRNPYKIDYKDYLNIQTQLWQFVDQLNQRSGGQYQISSRIELNSVLWA